MIYGYSIHKFASASSPAGVAYRLTRHAPIDHVIVDGLISDAPLRALAVLILRDLLSEDGQVPTIEDADELVRLELEPLNQRPFGICTVPADRIRRWLDARMRADHRQQPGFSNDALPPNRGEDAP